MPATGKRVFERVGGRRSATSADPAASSMLTGEGLSYDVEIASGSLLAEESNTK